jgi:hypothetical protein
MKEPKKIVRVVGKRNVVGMYVTENNRRRCPSARSISEEEQNTTANQKYHENTLRSTSDPMAAFSALSELQSDGTDGHPAQHHRQGEARTRGPCQ